MEAYGIHRQPPPLKPFSSEPHLMNPSISANFRAAAAAAAGRLFFLRSSVSFSSSKFRFRGLCTSPKKNSALTTIPLQEQQQEEQPIGDDDPSGGLKKRVPKKNTSSSSSTGRVGRSKFVSSDAAHQLKEQWLDSLTYPFPTKKLKPHLPLLYESSSLSSQESESESESKSSQWVIGIDPDVSGALALLKTHHSGSSSAQVFDSPHLKVLVGKRTRRRLDTKSIIELLQSFGAPIGTTAYLEQSLPYPQDGKQGWWSGGFSYGLWIGVLVASGFSVVPVPSLLWKNEFKLSGNGSSKDDSRELASALFPSLCSLLKRKKDHGRAEALLIAAYGKGLEISSCHDSSCTSEDSVVPQK